MFSRRARREPAANIARVSNENAEVLKAGVPTVPPIWGPYRNRAIAKPDAPAGTVRTTLVMGDPAEAAESSAPAVPTIVCVIVPKTVPPLKYVAVITCVPLFGSSSKPNVF